MIRMKRRITNHDKEKLLELQNKRRQKYGLRPRKTLCIEDLINLPTDKQDKTKEDIPPKKTDGGMYQ
ncbi:MAG: hypothetical protein R6V50_04000 [Thermoplasmatota archaeon]